MQISAEGQRGFSGKKLEKGVPAKSPEALVISLEPDVFLLNGNSCVGKDDPFKIVGRFATKAAALQAAEALFEKMGQLSLNSTVKSDKKRELEQPAASPAPFMEEPPKKIKRSS